MKTLVTGGAGFIGSHVAAELLRRGHDVVVLDDLSGGDPANVPDGALLVTGSITDARLLDRLFREHSFTHVFHLAAYAAEGLSHFIRRFNYTNNVVGSMAVINECVKHEVDCLVFTSSIAVYGHLPSPMTEEMAPVPADPYGVAKYAVELDLAAANKLFGLPYIIFRPHNVYGEHQNIGDRYRNVIGIFMNQIMSGRPMTIFGNGQQKRAFSHISDVAPVIAASVQTPAALNQIFNIGSDDARSVSELAVAVAAAMGVDPKIEYLSARDEVHTAFSSHRKLQATFGVSAQVPLEEGVRRMAQWARSVGPRASKPFRGIEVTRNLPPSWQPRASAARK